MTTLRATQVPADLAGSGWYEILPPPPTYPELADDVQADWVVVGAGFAGLSAALRLARRFPAESIAVIDAQRIAWGAAGRNSGFMIDLPHELNSSNYAGGRDHDLQQIAQNRAAIEFACGAAKEFELEALFSPIGKLHGAADAAGLKALDEFSTHLTQLGESWTRLDANAMQTITGSGYYRGGIHTPGAVLIQPAGYILGLARGLQERYGVRIHEHTPLLSLETGKMKRLRTPKGSIAAPKVILATNGHVESLGLFRRRLMHVFTYASMTRPLTPKQQRRLGGDTEWGLIPAHPMGSTVRRLKGHRIVIRNVFSWNPNLKTSTEQIRRIGRGHYRSFLARFPMLDDVQMEYCWGGHLCLSRNSVPAFGEVEEGVYVAACQNGLGVTKGTLSGMLAADLAAGVDSELLNQWKGQKPPARLFPEPFMSLGARAYLKWSQMRAGRDF